MTKRPTVDVDEDYLKEIMAGGVSRPKKEASKPTVEQTLESFEPEQRVKEEKENILASHAKEPLRPMRKKREAYESVFLERKVSVARRQTYISSQLYEKINSFLPVIACHQFGITSYINNVLTHHLEQYKDDINELYERKSKKPF